MINAAFQPSLGKSYRIKKEDLMKVSPTMPFLNHLAKEFKFDLDYKWKQFIGVSPISIEKDKNETIMNILNAIELATGVPKATFRSKTREGDVIRVRHAAIYILYKNNLGSLKKIGSYFNGSEGNGMSHSSVINCINKVNEYLETKDKTFMETFKLVSHLVE